MNKTLYNGSGERLDYTFAAGESHAHIKDWIVILGHGVTGNKDRPVVVDTAAALNAAGFDTLRFSFAGNGNSEGDFRAATITKEVADLAAVVDAAASEYANIAYIGHSMGAAVGVIGAVKDRRIKALISLAGMVDTKTFAETEFGAEIPDQGVMWEDADCPLSSAFMQDLCQTIGNVEPQVKQIAIPWLLVHGTADDVVLPKDSETVVQLRGNDVQLIAIEGADHSFNEPSHKSLMARSVADWLSAIAALAS